MKANIGSADKTIRIILGVAILILFFTNILSGIVGIIFLALAAILFITSFISFCPIWHFFKISTRKKTINQPENLN
jgi:hypothetical protein